MRITCDPSVNMGYISVQPKNILGIDSEMFTVRKYVTSDKLEIPVIKDNVFCNRDKSF